MTPTVTLGLTRDRRVGADVDDAARAARDARRTAVLEARAEGFTLREIADVLGVSYQRVWQIAQAAAERRAVSTLADREHLKDTQLRPFHHKIRKHAQAAATHREQAREWIWRAHIGGVPELEIAEAAGSTIAQIRRVIAQVEALESPDLAHTAAGD